MSLKQRLLDVFAIDPAAGAVEFKGIWYSWETILETARLLETRLAEAGIDPDAPVGVLIRNRPGHLSALIGLVLADRPIVTVNPLLPDDVIAGEIRKLNLQAVVADTDDWSAPIRRAAAETGTAGLSLSPDEPRIAHTEGLERRGPGPFRDPAPGVIVEMLTSGTTGTPKRISIRTSDFAASLAGGVWSARQEAGAPLKLKRSPSILYVPMLHISGFYRALFAFYEGRPTVMLEKFSVEGWTDALRRYRPKTIGLPPTAMRMVLDAGVPKDALESLVAVTTGTAPLDTATKAAFEERYGIAVLCNYGATEFLGPVATWTLSDHQKYARQKVGSVGRAIRGTELRIRDAGSGAVLGPGEVGILEVRSKRFGPDADWVGTTDLASLDDDGFLFLHGRSDSVIIRGGFKVMPEAVSKALEDHPAIREAAVVGLKDERLGAVPAAAVELKNGVTVSEEDLMDFARQNLIAYQVPTRFRIVAALPRTPSMKVDLPAVRRLFE